MSYRYSRIDMAVGVGMCAIVFGALLLFLSVSGSFMIAAPGTAMGQGPQDENGGMLWLQPALGQAIVEHTSIEQRSRHLIAAASAEWDHAVQDQRVLVQTAEEPFGSITKRALAMPESHAARVQAIMGRSIVNFTKRGVHSGVLSSDYARSDYNLVVIESVENLKGKLDRDFEANWQPALGREIIEAGLSYAGRADSIQERLGGAILHLVQAGSAVEAEQSVNQYQIGSLMMALTRSGVDHHVVTPTVEPYGIATVEGGNVTFAALSSPDVSFAYLLAAVVGLGAIFFTGLVMSAARREARAVADAKRNVTRWVYRMAV
ncbi:conserved exported protein of unknown function [Nitrospira sp. KM1]|uniref:hypothetical protein n=1 Tax=Nitrospira sp. KM1 TaxID=1936990 RepID=UPI0013A76325|nr:hypothetical protein [Nitrospira sp. KM1]BCA56985.1 conserved exported protein of unknown function [Nitrospira sp. KM1]